jgi:peptidoglycan/LPS O-acetylase OafA/YrhL
MIANPKIPPTETTVSASAGTSSRLAHIDCLRAIATLLVGVYHLVPLAHVTGPLPAPIQGVLATNAYLDFGRLGVMLFFLISGYVISYSLLRRRERTVPGFVLSRFFRLYPVYWVSIVFVVFISPASYDATTYAANVTMFQRFIGFTNVNNLYWTLAVELVFYGLCVVLFVTGVLANLRRMVMLFWALTAYAVLAAMVHRYTDIYLPYGTPMFLTFMIGGSILRHMDEEGIAKDARFWGGFALYISALAAMSYNFYFDPLEFHKVWHRDFLCNTLAIAIFFVFTYVYTLRLRALSYIGLISYSFYLFHALLGDWIVLQLETAGWVSSMSPYVLIAILFAAAIGFSAVTYHLIERPAMNFGRRMSRALLTDGAAPLAGDRGRFQPRP